MRVLSHTMFGHDDVYGRLRTVNDLIRWGASRFREAGVFFGHGTDDPFAEAAALVLHALHLPHEMPPEMYATAVTDTELRKALRLIERRVTERVPAAYLTGEAWFCGLPFFVDERVLVPRSPIAELIERQFTPWADPERIHRILDLCTGCGCIAIACAYAFPDAEVDASDVSAEALEVAALNVERHAMDDRVRLVESDLFEALGGRRYDLIVSNPPYVDAAEMEMLPDEFRHEPEASLAAGDDGLAFALRILAAAPEHLEEDGLLVCEVGAAMLALEDALPDLPLTWIDFERGGDGVFVIDRASLEAHRVG